jgi:hypothetical protein
MCSLCGETGDAGRWRLIWTVLACEVAAVCIDTLLGLWTVAAYVRKDTLKVSFMSREALLGLWTTAVCHERERARKRESERDGWGLRTTAIRYKRGNLGLRIAAIHIKKDAAGTLVFKRYCWDSELQLLISSERLRGTLNYGRLCPERDNYWGLRTITIYIKRDTIGTVNYSR